MYSHVAKTPCFKWLKTQPGKKNGGDMRNLLLACGCCLLAADLWGGWCSNIYHYTPTR